MSRVDGKAARALVERIYDAHPCGCCWHIVLDDGNIDDASVQFCADQAGTTRTYWGITSECKTEGACEEIAPMLLAMSKTQRKKLYTGGFR